MRAGPRELADAIASLSLTRVLLVAVDFDGTLAPLVDDPDSSRMLPTAEVALLELAAIPDTHVAIVSGRALDVLERLTAAPAAVALVGSHGSEFRIDGVAAATELSDPERARLAELCRVVRSVAEKYDGALFEQKPAGAGLHTRRASRSDAAEAGSLALRLVAELEARGEAYAGRRPFVIRRGKDILEFSMGEADKGAALLRLRREFGASAVIFIGDDVTDEDGFIVLTSGDVGIKVGAGESAARYRVNDPEAVAELLQVLRDTRRAESMPPAE